MAYIGRDTDKISNVEVLDNITFDGSSSYTLQKGGSNFTPSSANTLLLSIDGVVQAGNFTVSGSTIDFGTAVAGTSTCDFILHYGVGLITAPSDGTVTTAKLADSSVSLAKLTATGTKDATTFLRGDNSFSSLPASGITQADMWRLTTNTSLGSKVSSNLERVDSSGFGYIGTGMSQSSGDWSFPETGIYLVKGSLSAINQTTSSEYIGLNIKTTTDNSSYTNVAETYDSISGTDFYANAVASTIFDVTNTSTHKLQFFTVRQNSNSQALGGTTVSYTWFQFIRLGDT